MKIAESILNALAEPVLLLDGSLCAAMANPAFHETMQVTTGHLEGKPVQELLAGEDGQARLMALLREVMAHGRTMRAVEVECVIPPNTPKVLALTAHRLAVKEDLAPMVLVELRDITREKETERRVQELNDALAQHSIDLQGINKELESFTHSVSHDLRTPLRLTNKIAHLLLQDHQAELPPGAVKKIHMILDSTHEMGKLIEDLLTFSRVSREPMKKRSVDLGRLVREVADELLVEQQGRDVRVEIDELPPCRADRALLKQVYLNLLANALKFTRPRAHAEIRVGSSQSEGETVYFVRDNGVGFDMAHAETMFLVFHRLHKAHDFEGSGVGLALVKRIIERHGGRVWAEGQPDQGATVYFVLGD